MRKTHPVRLVFSGKQTIQHRFETRALACAFGVELCLMNCKHCYLPLRTSKYERRTGLTSSSPRATCRTALYALQRAMQHYQPENSPAIL